MVDDVVATIAKLEVLLIAGIFIGHIGVEGRGFEDIMAVCGFVGRNQE